MTTDTPTLLNQETMNRLMTWQLIGDTGLSSQCLAATIITQGETVKLEHFYARQHPLDGGDLNRCVKLMRHVPELRVHLPIMRHVSEYWAVLVDHWDELETLLDRELLHHKIDKAFAGTTYKRMKELYAPIDAKRYKLA